LLVVRLLLVVFFTGAVPTAQAGENDDVKVLLDLESKMARAWVQQDAQTLEQILADDYTLAGAGDALIGKDQYVAGLDNPEFRTTSAIVNDTILPEQYRLQMMRGLVQGYTSKADTPARR